MTDKPIKLPELPGINDYLEMDDSGLKDFVHRYYDLERGPTDLQIPVAKDSVSIGDDLRQADLAQLNTGRIRVTSAFNGWDKFFQNDQMHYFQKTHRWDEAKQKDREELDPLALASPRGVRIDALYKPAHEKLADQYWGAIAVNLEFRLNEGEIQWKVDREKQWNKFTENTAGKAGFQALRYYITSTGRSKIKCAYDAELLKYYDLRRQIDGTGDGEVTLDLKGAISGVLDDNANDDGTKPIPDSRDNIEHQFESAMVALIKFGWLKEASAIDIKNGTAQFASKKAAREALEKVFRVESRDYYDPSSHSLSMYIHGQHTPTKDDDVYVQPRWAWGAVEMLMGGGQPNEYTAMQWGQVELELPVAYFEYYPFLVNMANEVPGKLSAPEVYTVLDPRDAREATRHAFRFKSRGVDGELFNFEIPEGWRLPTPEELEAFRRHNKIFNGRTYEDNPDYFVLGRATSGKHLPVLQVWMIDQFITDQRAFEAESPLIMHLSHEEAVFMLNLFEASQVSPIPNPQTGELEYPVQRGMGKIDFSGEVIRRPYAVKIPTHVLEQAEIKIKTLLQSDSGDPVQLPIPGTEETAPVDRKLLETMLEYVSALKEGNVARLAELDGIIKSQETGMLESLEAQTKMLVENRLFQVIFLLVIGGSAALSFQQTRLLTGLTTKKERRKMYDDMCPDLVGQYRQKLDKRIPLGRKVIGRTDEIRTFLHYLAGMKLGEGKPTGGALEAPAGTGKDFLFHGAAITLATGKYPDGTPVEPKILDKVKRLRVFDPEAIMEGSSLFGMRERKFKILVDQAEAELKNKSGEFIGGTFFITNEAADKMAKGANAQTGDVGIIKDVKGRVGDGLFPHILVFATEDHDKVYKSQGRTDGQQTRRYPPIYPNGLPDQKPEEVAQIIMDEIITKARDNGWALPEGVQGREMPQDWDKIPDGHPLKELCRHLAVESRAYLPDQGNPSRSWELVTGWLREQVANDIANGVPDPFSRAKLESYLSQRGTTEAKQLIENIKTSIAGIMESQGINPNDLRQEVTGLDRSAFENFEEGLKLQPHTGETAQQHLNRLRALKKHLDSIDPRTQQASLFGAGDVEVRLLSPEEQTQLKRQIAAVYLHGTNAVNALGEFVVDLQTMEIGQASAQPSSGRAEFMARVHEDLDAILSNSPPSTAGPGGAPVSGDASLISDLTDMGMDDAAIKAVLSDPELRAKIEAALQGNPTEEGLRQIIQTHIAANPVGAQPAVPAGVTRPPEPTGDSRVTDIDATSATKGRDPTKTSKPGG